MEKAQATALLTSASHRMTKTRQLILTAVLRQRGPFSAADLLHTIHSKLHGHSDLVTIYRNLPVFEEAGIICRSDFSDEMALYVVAHPGHEHHHHHIVCRRCHKVEAVDSCALEIQEKALKKLGFKEISHRLEFSGICRACS
jgi:Fur family ferric uptake transcriptional regulator